MRLLVLLLFMGCGEDTLSGDIPSVSLKSVQCESYDIEGMTYYRAILEGLHPTEISDVKFCADRSGDLFGYDDLYEYSCWSDPHLGFTGEDTVVHCASYISASVEYNTPIELTNRTVYYREGR